MLVFWRQLGVTTIRTAECFARSDMGEHEVPEVPRGQSLNAR